MFSTLYNDRSRRGDQFSTSFTDTGRNRGELWQFKVRKKWIKQITTPGIVVRTYCGSYSVHVALRFAPFRFACFLVRFLRTVRFARSRCVRFFVNRSTVWVFCPVCGLHVDLVESFSATPFFGCGPQSPHFHYKCFFSFLHHQQQP